MVKNSQSIIALNLLKIREYTGYTVERLAELIGVDKELIEQWEVGVKEEYKNSSAFRLMEYMKQIHSSPINCIQ